LKPYKPERLKEAVHRARDLISNKQAGMAARGLLDLLGERQSSCSHLKRLTVKDEGRVSFIDVGAIHAIEAAGKYAVVHVGQEKHVLGEGMNWLEAHLPTEQFFRLSRSVIVNVSQIKELQALFKGENVVILKNGSRFSTTRPLREIQQKLEFP